MKKKILKIIIINLQNNELEFSYEYFVYVRPCMTFINMIPFDLNITLNDFIKLKLEKNKKENIYYISPDYLNNNQLSLKIFLDYYEKKYKSDYTLPEEDLGEVELFEDQNDYSERKNINMLKLPKEIELESDIKYTLISKG